MSFGQQSGPPASAKQVQELLALLQRAGYDTFREARGPLQLTQRQGGGKFTRDEADALRARLEAEEGEEGAALVAPAPSTRVSASEQALRTVPAEQLAAELQRRGWIVVEP
jgi:hypothetical protein